MIMIMIFDENIPGFFSI